MQMEVIHALTRILARVGDDAVPVGVQPLFARHLCGKGQEPAQLALSLRALGIPYRAHMRCGNHQDVNRRPGVDVSKGQSISRPFDDGSGNLPRNNFAE